MQQPEILLILLFFLGVFLQRISVLPKDLYRKLNKLIIYIPLPAIILSKIPYLQMNTNVIYPIAAAWIIFFGSAIYAYGIGKLFLFDKKTIACLVLCCGLGNTSFVGYPLLKYFYGEQSIQYAIFVDQPGSFLILSTFGVLIAAGAGSSVNKSTEIVKRLIKFPPFLMFIVALFIPSGFIEGNTLAVLNVTGKFMVPLAILSLGLQFKTSVKEIEWKKFLAGIFYKLVLAPLIIFILFFVILNKHGEMYTVSVMECAMPPMITSSILASEYGLDEKLANYFPTLGLLISIPVLFIWKWILIHF